MGGFYLMAIEQDMDSWYRWADHFVEAARQWRSYDLGALRGHMGTISDGYPDDYPYRRDVPVIGIALDWNEIKSANPWYFEALKQAAAIMPQRRAKYSGADPFDNFERVARITGSSVADAFQFDIALKLARLQVKGGDFGDESFNDSLRDLANYALLWYGYRLKQAEKSISP